MSPAMHDLARELDRLWSIERTVISALGGDVSAEADALIDAAVGMTSPVLKAIAAHPVADMDDCRVKLRALVCAIDGDFEPRYDACLSDVLAFDILRGLAALLGEDRPH